jgi:hypothetical protein
LQRGASTDGQSAVRVAVFGTAHQAMANGRAEAANGYIDITSDLLAHLGV